ncbi:hypothetical protein PanWU01x14_147030 [Parasponia andersonii]|uniref:Uncharacterized protein n=1 Tax=Parasponia andersonii TaxID=3476 RepID=A0A2P5CJZ3_PARAD|nr:hypothetical protein PanWU01x14_147030 [Parasponia andersonii]
MVPVKELDRKLKINRVVMFSPIQVWRSLESLLSLRSRLIMAVQFFKEDGISPEKLFFDSIKNLAKLRKPIELGMVPERLLFDMSTTYKNCKLFQKSGTSPDN